MTWFRRLKSPRHQLRQATRVHAQACGSAAFRSDAGLRSSISFFENDRPNWRGKEPVARVMDLRTIRDEAQNIHFCEHFHVVARLRYAVDNRALAVRIN